MKWQWWCHFFDYHKWEVHFWNGNGEAICYRCGKKVKL